MPHLGGGENTRWDDRDVPPPQTHPSHKNPKSHSALQLYISLQGFLQLSASYSNPQLLPARNLTVRNLSARRLKPEECYCSGHSCTSTGLATAATVCVGREEGGGGGDGAGGGRGREKSKVWKRQLYVFSVLCGLMTKQHIVDSKLTHSSSPASSLTNCPTTLLIFLQHEMLHCM